jgi:predicted aldo/keto reductase-like oxidoreductase
MVYRKMGRTGVEVSALGYGCMRYPRKGGRIDAERTDAQLESALERGVNYFDTAWAYLNGQSEAILGKFLSRVGRERAYVADKILPALIFSRKDLDRILGVILSRLATDRVDFLLMHSLSDFAVWERLKSLGALEFLEAARRDGRIRFAGFSWHGDKDDFKRVVDDYPWDFCQIQYNYLDEHNQAGREGLEHAAAKGLGVVVMEPLRGGSLVGRMPPEAEAAMRRAEAARPGGASPSPAALALNWIWDHPGVSTILSGLNEERHIDENVALAERSAPLSMSEADKALLAEVRSVYERLMRVRCTGCGYCMPCPFGVNIPFAFAALNSYGYFRGSQARFQYNLNTSGYAGGRKSAASVCTKCGACEKKCPQHIEIRKSLDEASRELESGAMKLVASALGLLRRLRGEGGRARAGD